MSSRCRVLTLALVAALAVLMTPAPAAADPGPTLLPVATTTQVPLTAAYSALNVPALAAGSSYLDPTTGVKIYKLTSATYPVSSPYWSHDYSEGGDEVSLPYNGNTRAVLVRQNSTSGGPWWLLDYTPGVGVSNPRQLTGTLSPWIDGAFAFSNNPATPYYAYVSHSDGVIRRIDIRTMTEAPGGGWPITDIGSGAYAWPTWLHQAENDSFFTWMLGAAGDTVVGYEPSTGTRKTYTDANLNEPRIDRAGRYVGVSMNTPQNGLVVWDWLTNSVVWTTTGVIPFAHNASLRDRWVTVDWNLSFPDQFAMFTPNVPNSAVELVWPAPGTTIHGSGNWIQHPTDLNDQWAVFLYYGGLQPTGSTWLAPGGMILMTPNGQRRLLGHPYNTTTTYNYFSFAQFSSDGQYVLFTSDMTGSGRSAVFLAELPQSTGSTPVQSALSPASVAAGAAGFGLTVTGSNFVSGSTVQWNAANRTTTFLSSTQLQATIPATDVATAGTAQVTVVNPAPGGTSNALTFTIGSTVALAVVRAGTGSGTVTSTPAGITCGTSCSATFPGGTAVTLTATPATGSTFSGWSGGGCSGTGACTVTLSAATTVTATFALQTFTLTVSKAGTGSGTVTSSPAGITCGTTCSAGYANGTAVTLTATPATGSTFSGWSGGGCAGTGACTLTLSAATTVNATFTPTFTLTVTKAGTGGGTV